MDLSAGTQLVAIPGPSVIPEAVRIAMSSPMPNIYAGDLLECADRVLERLPAIARTAARAFIATSNGHGAWELAVQNVLAPGDRVLVVETGRFAVLWGEYAERVGATVDTLTADLGQPVGAEALSAHLDMVDEDYAAVLVSHTDTMTSVRNDVSEIRRALDACGSTALLMADCIASLGCEPYLMDDWGVDVTVSASQKGLMCPPGLGIVWADERAIETYRGRAGSPATSYFDWGPRLEPRGFYDTFSGTPPVAHIRALDVALDLIDNEGGLDAVWARHEVIAAAVRAAVEAWSTPDGIGFVAAEGFRSNAVTTVSTGVIDATALRQRCEHRGGLTLGIGMTTHPDQSFRIGHMGMVSPPMILGTLGVIEAGLRSMNAPIGQSGVAAASEVLATALAQ